ncbi:MAG: Holliday junction resolvase RuvX, partial [Atopobium minutum]|nr:Holliday junction resolvase RuvX [Atopobium minutum]
EARIGIATSDVTGRIASPVKVLPAQEVLSGARSFRMILEDYEPELLVCGRPKTMTGEDGPQAQHVMDQAQQIAKACGLALEFVDERLSSCEAKRILREQGLSEKSMRGKVDMVAASLFLQSWLDAQAVLNTQDAQDTQDIQVTQDAQAAWQ